MRNSSESSIEPARDSHLFFLSRQFLCQCRNTFRNRSDRIGVHGIGVFSIKLRVCEAALLQRIVQPVYANLKGVKLRAHRLGIVVLRIGRLAIKHIRDHWYEILRLATSIKQGTVTASLMQRNSAAIRGRMAWPWRCASWGEASAACSSWTGCKASSFAGVSMPG